MRKWPNENSMCIFKTSECHTSYKSLIRYCQNYNSICLHSLNSSYIAFIYPKAKWSHSTHRFCADQLDPGNEMTAWRTTTYPIHLKQDVYREDMLLRDFCIYTWEMVTPTTTKKIAHHLVLFKDSWGDFLNLTIRAAQNARSS